MGQVGNSQQLVLRASPRPSAELKVDGLDAPPGMSGAARRSGLDRQLLGVLGSACASRHWRRSASGRSPSTSTVSSRRSLASAATGSRSRSPPRRPRRADLFEVGHHILEVEHFRHFSPVRGPVCSTLQGGLITLTSNRLGVIDQAVSTNGGTTSQTELGFDSSPRGCRALVGRLCPQQTAAL